MNPDSLGKRFETAIDDARSLVTIHQRLRPGERGRRHNELVLNRSVIFHSVAAWQVQVEVVARALLDALESMRASSRLETAMFQIVRLNVAEKINRFNSPNAANTAQLLESLGYDVRQAWTWTAGNKRMKPDAVARQLDHWVQVRHKIAHGDELPDLPVITRNRSGPTVRLKNAQACIRFFESLACATQRGALDLLPKEPVRSRSFARDYFKYEVPNFTEMLAGSAVDWLGPQFNLVLEADTEHEGSNNESDPSSMSAG